ncbi:mediator of RNA polymerase II transcription subunit 6 [Nematocida sp. AWRm80]|nr:mediator of RNA polymerase II transcription subunit 6 [Nematocida sp. AWRm80]
MENTCFRDPAWLQYNPLDRTSALEYFSFSHFYDQGCNNEVLKMQTVHSMVSSDTDDLLRKMVGIQYTLTHSEEPFLFVIQKSERVSTDKILVLDYYYIIHGTVYQAPTEKEVSKVRYTNLLFSLMNTLDNIPFRAQSSQVHSVSIEEKRPISSSRIQGLFNSYYSDYKQNTDKNTYFIDDSSSESNPT